MDGKTKAIVAHITVIGWIIAVVVNSQQREELSSFYIRQVLGIWVFGLLAFLPGIRGIVYILSFVMWVISLIGAISGEEKPIPIVGEYFQNWFRGI